ncbi:aminotransferase class IV family protein [Candidatus Nomurabacteria bacterium]|nr:aminotransferase class IV family protein [Candidatus Nomurabacteria bacterium]
MKKFCYFGGKIIPMKSVGLKLNDIGVLRGYGSFDFMRAYNGQPFMLKDHYNRFKNSSQSLGLKIPITEKQLEKIIKDLLLKNKMKDASLRLVMTGGETLDGMTFKKPIFFMLMEDTYDTAPKLLKSGVKLITNEFQRSIPESKTTNYMNAVRLSDEKKKRGAFEILYVYKSKVLEGAFSNFFIIKGNKLITAKENILHGITRKIILEIAPKVFKVEVRDVNISELKTADEAFVTGTNKKVTPVVQIDNLKIGDGKVGGKTKLLMKLLEEYIQKKCFE